MTGDNGLLTKAGEAKNSTDIGKEKEMVALSSTQARMKDLNGILIKVNLEDALIQNIGENKTVVIEEDEDFIVKFIDKNRFYRISGNGKIDQISFFEDKTPGDITRDKDGNALNGTEKPYEIWSIEDLVVFSNLTNGSGYKLENGEPVKISTSNNFLGKKVILKQELNFKSDLSYINSKRTDLFDNDTEEIKDLKTLMTTGSGFNPIRNYKGSFDGENNEIKNILIENSGSTALFVGGSIPEIRNLGISGKITGLGVAVAGIFADGSVSLIDNCYNKAEIIGNGTNTNWAAGVAVRTISKITNCYNTGNVTNINCNVGQAGGINSQLGGNTIENCYNTGNISGKTYVGGIAGGHGNGKTNIKNSYNTGNISTGSSCGGILGTNGNIIENCFNKGRVSSSSYSGGIVGTNVSEIYNCYNIGEIKGSNIGGICRQVEKKMINCYNATEIISSGGSAGGLAYTTGSTTIIANCFNTASTEGGAFGDLGGLIAKNEGTLNIYNSYSIGQSHIRYYNGNVYSIVLAGLVCNNSGEVNLNKCYYLKTDKINKAVTGMDDEEDKVTAVNVKTEITAETLNNNIQNIEHTDDWVQWKNTSEGYPVLDFSNIENYPKEK